MAPNETDPAGKDGAGVDSCPANAPAYSRNGRKNQLSPVDSAGVTQQFVVGDVGPIHLIDGPRVVVERHRDRAFVFASPQVWGWPPSLREFLNPDSPAILKYAQALALRIKDAALKEEARLARIVEAHKQEAEAFRAERDARR